MTALLKNGEHMHACAIANGFMLRVGLCVLLVAASGSAQSLELFKEKLGQANIRF